MAESALRDLPIVGYFDVQRFKQFSPANCANWYLVPDDLGKKKVAMYPVLGRKHIQYLGENKMIFAGEPRGMFKTVKFGYVVQANRIYRIDQFFNQIEITNGLVKTITGFIQCDFIQTELVTFIAFTDGQGMYVYNETTGVFSVVTDPLMPAKPNYIVTFGNRFAVSSVGSTIFYLTKINLGGNGYDPASVFTITTAPNAGLFASETGVIMQMGVLHNTLYIWTPYKCGIWSNIPSQVVTTGEGTGTFPWKKNTTMDFDYGMAQPESLDIDFGMMTWVAENENGLLQTVVSTGTIPKTINSKAVDVLFQRIANAAEVNPFAASPMVGFLYMYENTTFYRLTSGTYSGTQLLDQVSTAFAIEYNFETGSWTTVIEKNGERNRAVKHLFFANRHLISLQNDNSVYEMSGQYYTNDITNPKAVNSNADDAYLTEAFRYIKITPIITIANVEPDSIGYAEFETEYLEIDFVWGESNLTFSDEVFSNTQFIIDEINGTDGKPIYLIDESMGADGTPIFLVSEEGGEVPPADSLTYNKIFKPTIELYWSDDGGITFNTADNREFSQAGFYEWRMRWYQLGVSRNRCYKLVCVSPVPIVVLGGVMKVKRVSGGAD